MFTESQQYVINATTSTRLFLRGYAGTGKTTTAVERLKFLLSNNIPSDQILLLTPQRALQDPYLNLLHSTAMAPGSEVTPATIGGLARRMLDLFWPLAAEMVGVAHPEKPPIFLTLETAQYYMSNLVRPHLEDGWFDSVVMDRNRLYSQILDNLNKSAMIGFSYQDIGQKLISAWTGDPAQRRVYMDTQTCASEFREYCLQNNLLDFSLQLEIFAKILWNEPTVRRYLTRVYRHIIYDNVEEDIPVCHDIVSEWIQECNSALLVFDEGAGYRKFLGADPESGLTLANSCQEIISFEKSFVINEQISYLSNSLAKVLNTDQPRNRKNGRKLDKDVISTISARFYPEMIDKTIDEIQSLVKKENISPSEIVILAPYLSDALRFSLMNRLELLGVPAHSHRPSRSLRDEPASQCLLTLAAIAHPAWGMRPSKFDFIYSINQSIENMDLVRAQLLAEVVYREKDCTLSNFDKIKPEMQERITYRYGSLFSQIREWIELYKLEEPQPLDHFLRRLFGEVLSQPGFGFHSNVDAAAVCANLIESVQKFRWAMEPSQRLSSTINLGKEYIAMLKEGVIAAQYVSSWVDQPENSVLIAPAYTFLMSNRPIQIQFWLDAASAGWYERVFQPLTHPIVLSRHWLEGQTWTDSDEVNENNEGLARLLTGLLHRCSGKIYLGLTDLSESGYEQRGALIRAFQQVFQYN